MGIYEDFGPPVDVSEAGDLLKALVPDAPDPEEAAKDLVRGAVEGTLDKFMAVEVLVILTRCAMHRSPDNMQALARQAAVLIARAQCITVEELAERGSLRAN